MNSNTRDEDAIFRESMRQLEKYNSNKNTNTTTGNPKNVVVKIQNSIRARAEKTKEAFGTDKERESPLPVAGVSITKNRLNRSGTRVTASPKISVHIEKVVVQRRIIG